MKTIISAGTLYRINDILYCVVWLRMKASGEISAESLIHHHPACDDPRPWMGFGGTAIENVERFRISGRIPDAKAFKQRAVAHLRELLESTIRDSGTQ